MKKLLLLTAIAIIATLSCTAQTYINQANGDTLKLFPKKTAITPPPVVVAPPTTDISALNAQEQSFDNIWYANGSAAVGGEVNKLNTKKGGVDINYHGRTSKPGPTWPPVAIDGKLPIMVDPYALEFNNRLSTQYESDQITPIAPPYEKWWISRTMPSATYEALFEDGAGYVANNGGDGVRILNAQIGQIPGAKWPATFETHIGRLVVLNSNTGSLYFDNVYQGQVSISGANYSQSFFNVGVITNNMDLDFMAMYFKKGKLPDSDATAIYTSLASKWAVGSIPNQILINNLGWTKTSGKSPVYTPQATVVNVPNGVKVADPSKWDYQWIWWQQSTYLGVQTIFSTKYQITLADLPAGYANIQGLNIKLRIRPKDTNGNSWRWFESNGQPY